MSNAPYFVVCECVPSGSSRRFPGSSSSGLDPSGSQISSSIGDGLSTVAGVSCENSVGEDK